jgi:hypothetical protein
MGADFVRRALSVSGGQEARKYGAQPAVFAAPLRYRVGTQSTWERAKVATCRAGIGDDAEVASVEARSEGSSLCFGRTHKLTAFQKPCWARRAAPWCLRARLVRTLSRVSLVPEAERSAKAPPAVGAREQQGTVVHVGAAANLQRQSRNTDESLLGFARGSELGELHARAARARCSGTAARASRWRARLALTEQPAEQYRRPRSHGPHTANRRPQRGIAHVVSRLLSRSTCRRCSWFIAPRIRGEGLGARGWRASASERRQARTVRA